MTDINIDRLKKEIIDYLGAFGLSGEKDKDEVLKEISEVWEASDEDTLKFASKYHFDVDKYRR